MLSKNIDKQNLLSLLYSLSELANSIKWSSNKNIMFQAGLIKLCVQESTEKQVEEAKKEPVSLHKPKETPKEKAKEEKKTNNDELACWKKVLEILKKEGKVVLFTNLIGASASKPSNGEVEIKFNNKMTSFAKSVLEKQENKEAIEKIISKEEGKKIKIKYVEKTENKEQKEVDYSNINIPINIIDE